MKTIWKYEFPIVGEFTLSLPIEAKVLTAFVQVPNHGRSRSACLWAEVELFDIDVSPIKRDFVVVGTGHPIPEGDLRWVATFQDGQFIWHLYEVL